MNSLKRKEIMTKQEVIQRIINVQNAIEKYNYITPNIAIGILSRINRIIAEIDEQTTTRRNGKEMEKVKALADKAWLCPSEKFDYLSRNEKRAIKTKLKKIKFL